VRRENLPIFLKWPSNEKTISFSEVYLWRV
jgi:hypothetical protein